MTNEELQAKVVELESVVSRLQVQLDERVSLLQSPESVGHINRDKFVVSGGKDTASTTASGVLSTTVNGQQYKVLIV